MEACFAVPPQAARSTEPERMAAAMRNPSTRMKRIADAFRSRRLRVPSMMDRAVSFDREADVYDRVRPGYLESLIDAALSGREIRDVLEVGCGPGKLTVSLIARRLRVEAVEPGTNLAAIARRRAPEAEVHVARFEELALMDARFESVPHRVGLGAAELIDLQRTTATHLSLDAEGRERVERGMAGLVEQLGGSFPIRQLAVLAVAERRWV